MLFSLRFLLPLSALYSSLALSNSTLPQILQPEQILNTAESLPLVDMPVAQKLTTRADRIHTNSFSRDEIEQALHIALNQGDVASIKELLTRYRQFSQTDLTLIEFADAQLAQKAGDHNRAITGYRAILARYPDLTPVKIQLATSLFLHYQDNDAKQQFEQALTDPALPEDISRLVKHYLDAISRRNEWQINFSAQYLRERNVNNASNAPYIENTPFKKNAASLPQTANGVAYGMDIERDFSLSGSHFLHIANALNGKVYWDKHDFDELTNRTYLGYVRKQENSRFALLPFYERQWYGGHRYKWSKGGRLSAHYRFTPHWQLSAATEYSHRRYFSAPELNGTSKLLSLTLLWQINPNRFIYLGGDVNQENTRTAQYSNLLNNLRLGWGEEWQWGISSRLALSYGKRQYRENLALAGGAFRFDMPRQDRIYQASATLWKRDWHWLGITPKLHFHWKKQSSNFATLYSYRDHSINILLEKAF